MISFKANLVHHTDVLKRNADNKYSKEKVSFIELDTYSEKDKQFIDEIKDTWDCPYDMVEAISNNFDYYSCDYNAPRPPRFFALTEQLDSFDEPDSSKALGLVQTGPGLMKNQIDIELLQTNPKYMNKNGTSEIKYIGTTILDSIKELYKVKYLTLYSLEDALPFYLKNKFRPYNALDKGRNLSYQA